MAIHFCSEATEQHNSSRACLNQCSADRRGTSLCTDTTVHKAVLFVAYIALIQYYLKENKTIPIKHDLFRGQMASTCELNSKKHKKQKALLFILRHLSCIANPKSYFLILIAAFVPSVGGIIMYKWQAR